METRRCVVVLGAGRSGTSLTMKLLESLGLRLSTDLVEASRDNPDGHFEDARINRAQRDLMQSYGHFPLVPRPADWATAPAHASTRQALIDIVRSEIGRDDRIWAFKDPRTCLLWPLWEEVLGECSVEPRVVFCVRSSSDVVRSLMTAYGLPQDLSEGIVLFRSYHALSDIERPICFVDYHAWESDPLAQLGALAEHCGLEAAAVDLPAALATGYRGDLNRESGGLLVRSSALHELDELLIGHAGGQDIAAIDAWCDRVRESIDRLQFLVDGAARLATTPPDTRAVVRGVIRDRLPTGLVDRLRSLADR